jgi:hypothetical protein
MEDFPFTDLITTSPTLRVIANRDGKINFDDLQSARTYKPMVA